MVVQIEVITGSQGLFECTSQVQEQVYVAGIDSGICNILVQHTSASLTIQENADPSAQRDLERWLNRLVPENDPLYMHVFEGADDMPAHIKSCLTATSLSIPILNGRLALGTWQGIYVWEHRHKSRSRQLVLHIGK
ncbi:secondary thiamine-phosphate synthase enzyme YjbQ [Neptunomonas phycophila]|uniref:secondary thiamine-phosphate synthase enzyme YjbQ n=1 Tax=Neptunomonas phycophila TaxID=1572645 RepID=UPI0030F7AF04